MPDQELENLYTQRLHSLALKHDELVERRAELDGELARINDEGRGLAQALRAGAQLELDDSRIPPQFGEAGLGGQSHPTDRTSAGSPAQAHKRSEPLAAPRRSPRTRPPQVRHAEMVQWCTTILRDSGRPMHVREILAALEQDRDSRGWRVPGAGKTANVSVHLAQEPETFTSTGLSKGVWALTRGWNA